MKTGDIITFAVDPEANNGAEEAAALVTRVYPDGSAQLRVFGETSEQDSVRNYADEHGDPFQTPEQKQAAAAQPTSTAAAPAAAPQLGPDLTAQLQQLLAALAAQQPQGADASTSAAGDG